MISINLFNKHSNEKEEWEEIKINTWNPELGESVEGKLIKIKQYMEQKVYVIESFDKKIIRVWGKTYLDQLMDEIRIDDYIRITYTGTIETKNERYMKKFNVERRINDE
jgi:hypothetical protein